MSAQLSKLATVSLVASLLLAPILMAATRNAGAVESQSAAQVEGRGWWDQMSCISCLATLAAASGGSVAGMIALSALSPEYVETCGQSCLNAI